MGASDAKIVEYKITEKSPVTHNTSRFIFELSRGAQFLFQPGDHINIYPDKSESLEFRSYTPTSTPDDTGYFELIIKHYSDGTVSRYMGARGAGDKVAVSGPHAGRHFTEGMARRVGMVTGGTGITPMISMIRTILRRGYDVEISLLFANKSVDDIILKEEFDKYLVEKSNFKRYYVVDTPPDGWEMGVGRINSGLLEERLPAPSDETIVFVCGPPLMQLDMRKKLIELGHEKRRILIP